MERLHAARISPAFCRNSYLYLLLSGALLLSFPAVLQAQAVTFIGTTPSVNYGNVNLCPAGKTTPAPCSETITLKYKVTESGTLGAISVVTQGLPNLDFTLAGGSTCTGSVTAGTTCTVNATFAPKLAGGRMGGVLITGESGNVIAKTLLYGAGIGPQIATLTNFQSESVPNLPGPSGLPSPYQNFPFGPGLAVDGAGDVFVAGNGLIEYPAGGGAPITFSGLGYTTFVTVDGAGEVFITGGNQVAEYPLGCFSPACSSKGVKTNAVFGMEADAGGDLFLSYDPITSSPYIIAEFPAGGAPPITIGSPPDLVVGELILEGANNIFTIGNGPNLYDGYLVEYPAGSNTPVELFDLCGASPECGYYDGSTLSGDLLGNLYITTDYYNGSGNSYSYEEYQLSQFAPLVFGIQNSGSPSTLPVTITNIGNTNLAMTPSFNNPDYEISNATPSGCLASTAPGGACTLEVAFSPTGVGSDSGQLTLLSNGAANATVGLQDNTVLSEPIFSPAAGVYASPLVVTITDPTPKAAIFYTTNGSTPTTSSTRYTGPIAVDATERLNAIAVLAGAPSAIATGAYTITSASTGSILNYGEGFAAADGPIQFNGSTALDGSRLQLTDGLGPSGIGVKSSAFSTTPVNVQFFTTDFTFQIQPGPNPLSPLAFLGQGLTFTIQTGGPSELGNGGGALGYGGIPQSVAIKFDLVNDAGEGTNSTGLYINGAVPTVPAINLTGTGIGLHSVDPVAVQVTYDGKNLIMSFTDLSTFATWSHSFAIDIPTTIGANTAYVGFTASTAGSYAADQEILDWTYVSGRPGASALPPPVAAPPLPEFGAGFNAAGLTVNGIASLSGTSLQLTNLAEFQAGSAFYSTPLNIQKFNTQFTFQLTNSDYPLYSLADGFTFAIQTGGPRALGRPGSSLGYAGIPKSVAVKFDLHNNAGEGSNSTGLYINGKLPTVPAIDLTGTPIDLHSGNPIIANLAYDGSNLVLTLTDAMSHATWSHSFTIDIPATVGSDTAYVGFTAATGGDTAEQSILDWTFTNP